MDPRRLPIGLAEADQCTHLAVQAGGGMQALCGVGEIVRRLPGLWDPTDPIVCVHCLAAIDAS